MPKSKKTIAETQDEPILAANLVVGPIARRSEARSSADVTGTINVGQKVAFVELFHTPWETVWGRLDTGGFACIKLGSVIFFSISAKKLAELPMTELQTGD